MDQDVNLAPTDANTNPAVKLTDTLIGRAMSLANVGDSVDVI